LNLEDFLSEYRRQRVWTRGGKRAPHKALALLYALGELRRGRPTIPYATGAPAIKVLLERFGPPKSKGRSSQPIWRLRPQCRDDLAIWKVTLADGSALPDKGNPPEALLSRLGIFALSDEAVTLFTSHPEAIDAAAASIADSIVPATLRDELLDATVGVAAVTKASAATAGALAASALSIQDHRRVRGYRIQRDPRFASAVLEAYGYRCAVCKASPRLGNDHFGLEAAHIRWVQASGPNAVSNGLCLCRMHHVALDRGAFTIEDSGIMHVSPLVDDSDASKRLFWDHDRSTVNRPTRVGDAPAPHHCEWHRKQVFRDLHAAG
jgi:putative restriction endonuclease